jgi:hypothetical protein
MTMTAVEKWIEKVKKELVFCHQHYTVQKERIPYTPEMRSQLIEEMGNSKYTLEGVKEFLIHSKQRVRFSMNCITIDVVCNRISKNFLAQIARTLYRTNAICRLFGITENNRIYPILLVPFNEPRRKPKNAKDIVEPKHVNGGYTYINNGTIYIYRFEEWPKVVLHEILHNVPKIQSISWSHNTMKQMYRVFDIDTVGCPDNCTTDLEPTEGVVEAWAIFLHTVFMSIETPEKDFSKLLDDEIQWNKNHIRWIQHKQEICKNKKWSEKSHLFSYIVLRGIILQHLNSFLKLSIPYDEIKLARFWIEKWQIIEKEYKENKNKNNNEDKKNTTLKMSRYGDV